ncbi:MAG: divalent-cation tolerance protein CutA [Xanthomonadales bacterium]|nr:divalent-cation tolerance protein CutA [Xanthomonadales bacterium]
MSSPILLVLCTAPDPDSAKEISQAVVAEKLAACVNRLIDVQSVFRWEGTVQSEAEVLLLLKTTEVAYPRLEKRLVELHPYELPEVIAVEVSRGLDGFLDWIREGTSDG